MIFSDITMIHFNSVDVDGTQVDAHDESLNDKELRGGQW